MFQKIAKHRANDASNDVHRPPLPKEGGGARGVTGVTGLGNTQLRTHDMHFLSLHGAFLSLHGAR